VHELHAQIERPDAIVLSVGGGGLLAGVLEGMDDVGWSDVPVLAVETRGAESFFASMREGKLVTLDAITSIAITLGAKRVSAEAFERAKRHDVTPWVVSDAAALRACVRFLNEERTLVEPACGAALSALYDAAAPLAHARSIAVIVCGGAGIDLELLAKLCDKHGVDHAWAA
jgi:L-serine/L-threonine ammonia-lyase